LCGSSTVKADATVLVVSNAEAFVALERMVRGGPSNVLDPFFDVDKQNNAVVIICDCQCCLASPISKQAPTTNRFESQSEKIERKSDFFLNVKQPLKKKPTKELKPNNACLFCLTFLAMVCSSPE
jgi:hypothetical protein